MLRHERLARAVTFTVVRRGWRRAPLRQGGHHNAGIDDVPTPLGCEPERGSLDRAEGRRVFALFNPAGAIVQHPLYRARTTFYNSAPLRLLFDDYCQLADTAVSKPKLTVGRPSPITPFTPPASKNVPAIAATVTKSNMVLVYSLSRQSQKSV